MIEDPDRYTATRWSLITRLKDWSDQASWQEFFNTHWKLIYSMAIKAGLSDVEAREVVQETVITVAKKIKNFRTDPSFGSFKSWLLHVTQWRIADQLRKRHVERRPDRPGAEETASTSTTDRIADPAKTELESLWNEEWEKNLIDAALEKIKHRVNAKQFQLFYLHVIKGQPVGKVARSLGVNVAQVYLAKHRLGGLVKKEVKNLRAKMI
jgi:RNA polymerase sigma-70 factor (ECF subfamily)